jgi:hypothetical protein
VSMKIAVFCACCLHHQGDETRRPDDGGSKHLWNVGKLLPHYTAQQPRRQPSSTSRLSLKSTQLCVASSGTGGLLPTLVNRPEREFDHLGIPPYWRMYQAFIFSPIRFHILVLKLGNNFTFITPITLLLFIHFSRQYKGKVVPVLCSTPWMCIGVRV